MEKNLIKRIVILSVCGLFLVIGIVGQIIVNSSNLIFVEGNGWIDVRALLENQPEINWLLFWTSKMIDPGIPGILEPSYQKELVWNWVSDGLFWFIMAAAVIVAGVFCFLWFIKPKLKKNTKSETPAEDTPTET